jgi:hypothetical protein
MSTLIRSALVALVLTSASAGLAVARPAVDPQFTDQADQYGGFNPNSQEGNRAFWENQTRHGH